MTFWCVNVLLPTAQFSVQFYWIYDEYAHWNLQGIL